MNLLYWNTNGIDAIEMIIEMASEHDPVLIFISEQNESSIESGETKLRTAGYEIFENPGCDRVTIFKRNDLNCELNLQNHFYTTINLLDHDIYVVALHLPSQMWQSLDSLKEFMRDLRVTLDEEVGTSTESKILLIGDFNVNPYESPLTHYDGFVATNSPRAKHVINHLQKSRTTYYNPTWQLYVRKNFPGTKRFKRPAPTSYDVMEFHYLDQVILSQKLLESISSEEILVIEKTTNFIFFDEAKNKIRESDHLPLLYKMKFN